jgi:predicted metal-dependent hydrolase
VQPRLAGVKTFKSRWGGCNVRSETLFHWKVILAPHRIIDFVVAHELCHLKHHDHSPTFWKLPERVIPDYLERKRWLKRAGVRFDL